jgi:hypothetical protein
MTYKNAINNIRALPWLRQLVTYLSLKKLRSNSRPVHVGFIADNVAL